MMPGHAWRLRYERERERERESVYVIYLSLKAYNSWMQGNLMFELQKWQEALDAFGQSQ